MGDATVGKDAVALQKDPRDKKIVTVGWVIFFAMWAVTFLVERTAQVRLESIQYLAAGLILLGMNGARFALGIPVSRITLVAGLLAAAGGILWQTQGEIPIYMMVAVTLVSLLVAEGILRAQIHLRGQGAPVNGAGASGGKSRRRRKR